MRNFSAFIVTDIIRRLYSNSLIWKFRYDKGLTIYKGVKSSYKNYVISYYINLNLKILRMNSKIYSEILLIASFSYFIRISLISL